MAAQALARLDELTPGDFKAVFSGIHYNVTGMSVESLIGRTQHRVRLQEAKL